MPAKKPRQSNKIKAKLLLIHFLFEKKVILKFARNLRTNGYSTIRFFLTQFDGDYSDAIIDAFLWPAKENWGEIHYQWEEFYSKNKDKGINPKRTQII